MPLVCVDGAQVKIEAQTGEILVTQTASIPSVSQPKVMSEGKYVLLEDDIKQWATSFMTNYDFGSFKAGVLAVQGSPTLVKLATKGLSPTGWVTKDTEVTLQALANPPAADSTGSADGDPAATLKVTFTDPGQAKLAAV